MLLPAISLRKTNPSLKIKNLCLIFLLRFSINYFPIGFMFRFHCKMNSLKIGLIGLVKKIPFKAFFQSIRERVFIVFVNLNSNEAGHYELCLDPNYVSDYGPRLNTTYIKKSIKPIKKFNLVFQIFLIFIKANSLVSPFSKSNAGTYHVGGSFPMRRKPMKWNETNYLGELEEMKNLHLVDSSTFPTLPGTTIGLLSKVMAYAITKEALKDTL